MYDLPDSDINDNDREFKRTDEAFEINLSIASFFTAPTIRLCAIQIDLECDKNKLQLLNATTINESNSEELIF